MLLQPALGVGTGPWAGRWVPPGPVRSSVTRAGGSRGLCHLNLRMLRKRGAGAAPGSREGVTCGGPWSPRAVPRPEEAALRVNPRAQAGLRAPGPLWPVASPELVPLPSRRGPPLGTSGITGHSPLTPQYAPKPAAGAGARGEQKPLPRCPEPALRGHLLPALPVSCPGRLPSGPLPAPCCLPQSGSLPQPAASLSPPAPWETPQAQLSLSVCGLWLPRVSMWGSCQAGGTLRGSADLRQGEGGRAAVDMGGEGHQRGLSSVHQPQQQVWGGMGGGGQSANSEI